MMTDKLNKENFVILNVFHNLNYLFLKVVKLNNKKSLIFVYEAFFLIRE